MWKGRQKSLGIDDFGHPLGNSGSVVEQAPLLRGGEES